MITPNTPLTLDPESQTLSTASQPPLKDLAKTKHIFAPDVYVKAFFVPKGLRVITKAFREDHVTILAKGSVVVENPDGEKVRYVAPAHTIFKQGQRYRVVTLEDAVWYCVHPTEETDQATLIKLYE